jgi:hypothetical protein
MLRSRFDSIPLAVNDCLVPVETSDSRRKKGLRSNLHNRFKEVLIYFFYILLWYSRTLLFDTNSLKYIVNDTTF